MKSQKASTTLNLFLIFSIFSLLNFVGANNSSNPYPSSVQCPPPPPCICNPTPPLLPPPNNQPSPSPSPPNAQPLPPPAATPQHPPRSTSPQTPPSPPATTLPPTPQTTPPLSPPPGGTCSKNATELLICANIVSIADGLLTTGRAEPCCSIVRNLSAVDAVTCLCKSVGARPSSLSPNFGIFFRVCGRRIPQGFSCPGPSPTILLPPPNPQSPPPPQTIPPPPQTTQPLSPPSAGICSKNATELLICANIVAIADGLLTTGRAEPCCSIVRNLSDLDAVTCLCKSVGARTSSLSPNFGIFFRVCGRRIPKGFSCP